MDVWVGRVPRGPEERAGEQEEREREIFRKEMNSLGFGPDL